MKNKSLFSRLLENKKLLLLLSLVLSFMFWLISSDNIAKRIDDVPLSYSLSDSVSKDLKIFGNDIDSVTVSVKGKRVVIDMLSSGDLSATVDLSAVTGPTTQKFPITLRNAANLGYEIEKIEPDSISLMIDHMAKKSVDVVSNFTYSPEGYYVDNDLPSTIEISGPESVVNSIEAAYFSGEVNSPDASTVTNNYTVKFYDSRDITDPQTKEISGEYITTSFQNIDVTFRYLKINEAVPFVIKYGASSVKLSSDYYSVSPSTISIAGPENLITGDNAISNLSINIGSLSQYKNQIYNLKFNTKDILGSEFVNKSDGVETIKVQLDFSSLNTETFDVPSSSITVKNVPEGYSYKAPSTFAVTAVGSYDALERISASDFTVVYDFAEAQATADNYIDVPVSVTINTSGLCWVYRSSETVSVRLTQE